jgi:osmotically-inducible protein OsmY
LVRVKREGDKVTGIALSAALGLGIGVISGMLVRQFLSDLATEPVKNAVRGLRRSRSPEPADRDGIERAIEDALDADPDTHSLNLKVEALGDGIVELTGTTPDPLSCQIAADIARGVAGAEIVVNRILVDAGESSGSDSQSRSEVS